MTSTASSYPVGTQVILTGLQAAAEHNGKQGLVESVGGERQRVRLVDDEEKILAVRPKNLQLAPRSVDSLSVKELKAILQACDYKGTTTGMDKTDLQQEVDNLSTPEKNAQILMKQARQRQPMQSAAPTSSSATASSATTPSFSKEQMQSAADRMSSMDPSMLRQQAAMMRAMPADQVRRSNPMFANMTDAQIQQAIAQFEMMADNPAMMQQAAQQMKNMSPEELERQRQAVMGSTNNSHVASSTMTSSTTSNTSTTASTASTASSTPTSNNPAEMMRDMDPAQLKQQAAMLKSMPPSQVRAMHPQFATLSDDQIGAMAAQMEMMADNPAMMKMAAETMNNLTPEQLQDIQQGRMPSGMGNASMPATPTMDQAAGLFSNMTGKQVKDMLNMVKDQPELLSTAMPGTDTKQVENLLQKMDGLDEATLDRILAFLKALQKFLSPVIKAYQSANRMVRGHLLKRLALGLAALIYYRWFGAASTAVTLEEANEVPEIPVVVQESEFESEF